MSPPLILSQFVRSKNDRIAEKVIKISKALHYMCPEALYTEAFRVLRPGGLLAIAGYHFSRSLCLFSCDSTLLMDSLSSSVFSPKKNFLDPKVESSKKHSSQYMRYV